MLRRFADNQYADDYIPTIGADHRDKTIDVHGKTVKLQIWDIPGEERFRNLASNYYKGADGIVLVCDVADAASFEHDDGWLDVVDPCQGEHSRVVLVGSKCDDAFNMEVGTQRGEQIAEALGMALNAVSAKESTHIDAAFELVLGG